MADHERPDLADGQVPGVPSDNTSLLVILRQLSDEGWTADFHATEDGGLRCPRCGTVLPASAFHVDAVRRLEGASDPADEQIVLAVTCPGCGARGTVVLGYGPNASDADIAVLAQVVL